MKSMTVVKVLNMLIIVFLVLMAITFVTLPLLVDKYGEMTGTDLASLFKVKLFLYLTAIPFTVLLVMAKILCSNILQNNPFRQAVLSRFISLVSALLLIFFFT